ncbi:uncharacterized protein PADG_07094 [Paracoccidioides brasiliensis Pb18]|uniref:Uncharacterized protein n=1 Tax=Paracoccidioides brasiliensis (strain Pb18) TaxID=502780 RepID=C1GIK8_PARBD|nr:uncharacterized protein PADG_07094 [Paracoccidioides brasiliensis Pb18]EEH42274.2 hypothetical protein PADG_07094 [Paracoccidioides brasiliensis Pb18]
MPTLAHTLRGVFCGCYACCPRRRHNRRGKPGIECHELEDEEGHRDQGHHGQGPPTHESHAQGNPAEHYEVHERPVQEKRIKKRPGKGIFGKGIIGQGGHFQDSKKKRVRSHQMSIKERARVALALKREKETDEDQAITQQTAPAGGLQQPRKSTDVAATDMSDAVVQTDVSANTQPTATSAAVIPGSMTGTASSAVITDEFGRPKQTGGGNTVVRNDDIRSQTAGSDNANQNACCEEHSTDVNAQVEAGMEEINNFNSRSGTVSVNGNGRRDGFWLPV